MDKQPQSITYVYSQSKKKKKKTHQQEGMTMNSDQEAWIKLHAAPWSPLGFGFHNIREGPFSTPKIVQVYSYPSIHTMRVCMNFC